MEKQICYNSSHSYVTSYTTSVSVSITPKNFKVINLKLDSKTDSSSLKSLIPLIAALVDLAIIRSSSIFGYKLLMLRWIKCKPLDWKIFHLFKHCSLCWWLGPGFRIISPESNISKWKKEFKFLYLSLETDQKVLFIPVTENWKSSQIFMNSDAKKIWSATSSHFIKEIWRIFVLKR